jgi:hypothetical protein
MRKLIILLSISLCLLFNLNVISCIAEPVVLEQGLYKVSDFNFLPDTAYTIQNTSDKSNIYVFVFNEQTLALQAILLEPNSPKYTLPVLKSGYRIAILGSGKAYISELKGA